MFTLPEEIKEGIKDFKYYLDEYLNGRINPGRFAGVRVPWGIYSHRGGKIFMTRLRIPAGQLNPLELKAIAYAADTFGNKKAHITTRQDIQIHEVQLKDTAKLIEYLKDFNLSPRGGGGNTVRNITACALSGICKDEIFNTRNCAISLSEYLLKQESSFNLPRKLKISFSGCLKDCAGCLVNDIGFLAQEKNGKKGFKVFAGGGMGAEPALGRLLEEFILSEDLGYCVQAIKNVFYKRGDRKNKHHNRLRFLINDIGEEDFKRLYRDELKELKDNEYIVLKNIDSVSLESKEAQIPPIKDREFQEFLSYNLYPQKQTGLASLELRIPRGDIRGADLKALADLAEDFSGIDFRTAQNQNIFICNVKKSDVYKLFLKVKEILNDFFYPSTLLDVVCCKGALTCNLGLCNSPGLSEQVEKAVKDSFAGKSVFRKLNIKINGCPNACGQHPIGLIALYGIAKRVGGRPVPFYKLLLAGRKAAEFSRLAKDTGILIPAKNVPLFLKDFIERINADIDEHTDIYEYMDKEAVALAGEIAKKYSYVPPYSQGKDFYIDWGKQEEFSLEGLGPGECGAGVLNMIEADLIEAKIALDEAEKENYSAPKIRKAVFLSSRALLIVKGLDPKTEEEALEGFREKFIAAKTASEAYYDIKDVFKSIVDALKVEDRKEKFIYAKEFLKEINQIYKGMDSAFNFPLRKEEKKEPAEGKPENFLDLKGTPCPINYVKTKLFLENLNTGDILEVLLDEGEPIANVPKSLEADGHQIVKIEKLDGYYKVVVKKK